MLLIGIVIVLVAVASISCIRVIQQSRMGIIMRLGKFHKAADTGVHFLVTE